ncbi:MAG: hypothetical protein EPN17_00875 [Methylobacter sp.]|nr:MAG: hypothetical protein EPN17_00875 [Methylobacter sp.]
MKPCCRRSKNWNTPSKPEGRTDMSLTDTAALLADYLPGSIHELMTVISAASVAALIKARPGTRVQIPGTPTAEHWLVALIGWDDLNKLSARYGGTAIDIPRCVQVMTAAQDSRILADRRSGHSLTELALKYRMTERGISKALRRIEKQEYKPWVKQAVSWSQGDLFD